MRRVIVKAEHSAFGANPRFVVPNLPYGDRYLYDRVYCARGDMENRIKDQQLDLLATRTSCMRMAANQFRVLLSGLAYTLFKGLRRFALGDTPLETASPDRIRLTLLRIGAVVVRNTRRIASCSAAPGPTRRCSTPSPGASTPPDPPGVLPRHADKQRGLGVVTPHVTQLHRTRLGMPPCRR